MRIPKWFRRDRTDRRCSDTHAVMMSSSQSQNESSPTSNEFDDPIRTEEYKKAFAEFWARRSTGGIKENFPKTKYDEKRKVDMKKQNSEKKTKRFSLPDANYHNSEFITSTAPQIQIQLNNQFEIRSGGRRLRSRNRSLTSTSPDLLPPRFIRNRHVDFDESENPSSPPEDFFRDNSLPYSDKENSVFDAEILGGKTPRSHITDTELKNKRNKKRTSPSSNTVAKMDRINGNDSTYDQLKNSNNWKCFDDTDTTDARFGSAVRKLEQMCQIVKIPNCTHFRGVPLLPDKILDLKLLDCDDDKKIMWKHTTWNSVPVCVKVLSKKNLFSENKDTYINRHIFTDIDILTKIRHSNILLLMGMYCEGNNNVFTIFENNIGSLYENIHEQRNKLSSETIVSYLGGIASALVYLTSNKFIHTSVSSHNILLTSSNIAKLCSFELCTRIIEDDKIYQNNKNIYNKINTSSEHDYENITELNITTETENSMEIYYECLPQNKSIREFFSYFRWQAPELFDEINGLVYPCVKSDVYSLCLVLWECFNNSAPWKTLTYEKLSELYLTWGRGINLHNKATYPSVIYDILSEGLPVKSENRCTIQMLYKKFSEAIDYFNNKEKECDLIAEKKDASVNCNQYEEQNLNKTFETKNDTQNCEIVPFTLKMTEIKKYPVTNLDESNHSSDFSLNHINPKLIIDRKESSERLSSLGLSSKESLANTEIFLIEESYVNSLQNTDSTEYCSLLTPDRRCFNKTYNFESSSHPSKLSFSDQITPERDMSLSEKILKLNTSLTPKSYKPLQIEQPSPDTIDNLRSLADNFELKNNINKSTYSFDIEDTSLPITPIARSNKIKKNAWLSGKNTDYTDSRKTSSIQSNFDNKKDNYIEIMSQSDLCSKSFSNIDTQTEFLSLQTYHTENKMFSISHRCIGTDTEDFSSENNEFNYQDIRPRSHSLNSKPNKKMQKQVTGVDIKPIVAIHEKWILEAKRKQNRSFSLPDNFRGLYAVKPASHLTDPARPKNGSKASFDRNTESRCDKNLHGKYSDIPSLVRPAISKKRVINSSTLDFFENSLWRKEKEKCLKQTSSIDPQNSSTPKMRIPSFSVDKSTNTQSIEELCQKIMNDLHKSDPKKISKIPKKDEIKLSDIEIKDAKTTILAELTDMFEKLADHNNSNEITPKKLNNAECDKKSIDSTFTIVNNYDEVKSADLCDYAELSVSEKVKLFNQTFNKEELFYNDYNENCDHSSNGEDDCVSLPDNILQSEPDDVGSKSLKRCQAFSALQEARSTEDMYIDDELTANTDIHTLSDNMKLVPLPSNLHEASCPKGSECCLIQIQQENRCNRILLFYENSEDLKNDYKKDDLYFSDEDTDLIKLSPDADDSENDCSALHNDLLSSPNKLSVIEEKSDEDDTDEESLNSESAPYVGSGRVVQDLISLYEGEKKNKSILDGDKSQKEISVIMLDDDLASEKDLRRYSNMNNSHALIEDTVHV